MDEKHWYASKTIIANGVALVAGLLMAFGIELTADEQSAVVVTVMAIINIALRLVTTVPVTK
jgi:hypothetical protein